LKETTMPGTQNPTRRFRLGRLVATPGAVAALQRAGQDPLVFLERHRSGDGGQVSGSDARLNDEAVAHEGDPEQQERVLSAYTTAAGEKLWVITEADRALTCCLLPTEC
jgi:hypothetical protein